MSLWKFNNFEYDLDFTDVAFIEKFEKSTQKMIESRKHVLKTGLQSEITRSQCQVFFDFFDNLFGKEAHAKMFGDKISLEACLNAVDAIYMERERQAERFRKIESKFIVQNTGNRQQRRNFRKYNNHGKRK